MKNPNIEVYFEDMKDSVDKILNLTKGLNLEDFKKDATLQLAIERLFEILGEAANRVPKECQEKITNIPWSVIIGMRNIIIHTYDKVDSEQLFLTTQKDIPSLKIELDKVIL